MQMIFFQSAPLCAYGLMGVAAIHSLYMAGDLRDPAHPPLQHTHTQCCEISLHMQFSLTLMWDAHASLSHKQHGNLLTFIHEQIS